MKKNKKFKMKCYKLITFILFLVTFISTPTIFLAQEPWTTRTPMLVATSPRAASVVDRKIYTFGGSNNRPPYPGFSIVQMYDPATDTWDTTKTPMPTARSGASAVTVNGKIFVIGGRCSQNGPSYSIVEVYDPTTDTWDTTKSPMLTARWWQSASVVNGKIYVIGGERDFHGRVLSVVEEYDPAIDTWVTKNPMPTARWALSTSVVDGKIYAFGGCHQTSSPFPGISTVEEYDPVTDSWTKKKDMPNAMFWMSTSTVEDMVLAIGGFGSQNGPTYNTVEAYNPVTDTWTAHTKMPTARFNISTNVVNGKIYAIGGIPCSGCNPIETNEEYDPHLDLFGLIEKFDINRIFAKAGIDSVAISTKMKDPAGIELIAELVAPDQTPVDSFQLFDDGNHSDGSAGDSLYANVWPAGIEEQLYYVDLLVTRIDTDTVIHHMNNMSLFTTIGPIVFDHYTFATSDTVPNPGDQIRLNLFLKNNGSITTATNIEARLNSPDTLVKIGRDHRKYGDIAAGEAAQSIYTYIIDIYAVHPDNTAIPFTLEIISDDTPYWFAAFDVDIYPTAISEETERIPGKFALFQNYPNPFNPVTNITYDLPVKSDVVIDVFNILGQRIATLVNDNQDAGYYHIKWKGIAQQGNSIASGMYILQFRANGIKDGKKIHFSKVKKMVVVK